MAMVEQPIWRESLAQLEQKHPTPKAWLKHALSVLVESLPDVTGGAVYRAMATTYELRCSTDDSFVNSVPKADSVAYNKALESNSVMSDSEQQLTILPLQTTTMQYGVMSLQTSTEDTQQLTNLAYDLSVQLENVVLKDLMRTQTQLHSELITAKDVAEMAGIVAKYLASDGQFVSVTIFEKDETGKRIGYRAVATANRQQAYSTNTFFRINPDDTSQLSKVSLDDPTLYVPDVTLPNLLDDVTQNELLELGIQSLYVFALQMGDEVIGFFSLNDTQTNVFLLDVEIQAYQNLAHQISARVDAQYRQESFHRSQQVLRRLSKASRGVMELTTPNAIADTILKTLAQDATAVAITLFDRPLSEGEQPHDRTPVAFSSHAGDIDFTRYELFRKPLPNPDMIKVLWDGKPVIVDKDIIGKSAFPKVGIFWNASFPLRGRGQLLGTLNIMHNDTYRLTAEEQDAYGAIADQIGIALRSHQLLEERQVQESLAESLVEANRQIVLADDYGGILKAIRGTLPDEITALSLQLFDKAVTYQEVPSSTTVEALLMSETLHTPAIMDVIEADDLVVASVLKALHNGEMLTFPKFGSETVSLPANGVGYLREQGIRAVAIAGLRVGDRLWGILLFGSETTLPNDMTEARRFRTLADQIAVMVENRHLLNEAQGSASRLSTQVEILEALTNYANLVNAMSDEMDLLQVTARTLVEVLDVDHAGFTFLEPDGTKIRVVSEYPDQQTVGMIFGVDLSLPLWQRLYYQRETILVQDVDGDKSLPEDSRKGLQSAGIKSVMFKPVVDAENQVIGTVGLDVYTSGYDFDDEMQNTAQLLLNQLSLGLQKIRLLQRSQIMANQMNDVANFSQAVLAKLDNASILQTVLEQSSDILDFDYFHLLFHDDARNQLRIVARRMGDSIEILTENPVMVQLLETVAGQAWAGQHLIYEEHLSNIDGLRFLEFDKTAESVISTPLEAQGVRRGVMVVASQRAYHYQTADLSAFQQMANQVAVALENAEAYRQSQRLARNKALANDISTQLQQQIDIDSILNITARELGKALGANRARIRLGMSPTNGTASSPKPVADKEQDSV